MNMEKLTIRVPPDVKEWLAEQAHYNGATLGAEVSRCCRVSMEAKASKVFAVPDGSGQQ
jgi:hypothetical protein